MEQLLIGFYVGAGTTLAFAIGVGIWLQARMESRLIEGLRGGPELDG